MKCKIGLLASLFFTVSTARAEVDFNDPQAVMQKFMDITILGKAEPEELPPLIYLPAEAFEKGRSHEDLQKLLSICAVEMINGLKKVMEREPPKSIELIVPDYPANAQDVKAIVRVVFERNEQKKSEDMIMIVQKSRKGWLISGEDTGGTPRYFFKMCEEQVSGY